LLICIVGVIIFTTAPGNFVRLHAEHKLKGATSAIFPLSLQIKIALKAWIDHILKGKLPYATVFLIPAAVLISTNFEKFRNPRIKIDIRSIALLLTGVVTMAFIINGSIMYLAIKWVYGSERSYLLIMWLLIITLLVALSVILYKVKYNTKPILIAHFLAISFFSYYSLKTCYVQLPIVKKYSEAEDKRVEFIQKLARDRTSGIVTLDSLPESGLLMSAEISKDTLGYVNFDMKNCFGLQCDIRI